MTKVGDSATKHTSHILTCTHLSYTHMHTHTHTALPSSPSFNHSYLLVPMATQPLTNISITFTPHTSSGLLLLFTTTPTAADNYMAISLNTTNIVVETHQMSGVGWQAAVPYWGHLRVWSWCSREVLSGVSTAILWEEPHFCRGVPFWCMWAEYLHGNKRSGGGGVGVSRMWQ